MTPIVVDTSLAIKWAITEPDTDRAEALRDDALRRSDPIYAPSLLGYEVTNVLYDLARTGAVTWAEADQVIDDVLAVVRLRVIVPALAKRALEIARAASQTYAYDAQFLALAEAEGCDLWTADVRFQRAMLRHGFGQVRLVSTYPVL